MHHINIMCHEQGRQLLRFWFLNYFPLTRLHIVNCVPAITLIYMEYIHETLPVDASH